MPTDLLSPDSLAVFDATGQHYLLPKDVSFIREAYPLNTTTEAFPRYYAIFNPTSFILAPTPDQAYQVELHYFGKPESIVTAGTSWLGTNFESVLLSACLLEAYIFLKGETDLIQVYNQRYMDALQLLKGLGEGRDRSDEYRNTPKRIMR